MGEWLKQEVRAGRQLRGEGRLAEVPSVREQLKPAIPRIAAGLEALQREWKEDLPKIRILCLSGACDNPRMWVHYADDHRGAVIGFQDIPGKNSALCEECTRSRTKQTRRRSQRPPKTWPCTSPARRRST